MLTVLGEALIDIVNGRPHVGGSPMNVAVGLARLGHATQFIGRYGQDPFGTMIADHLRANSVAVGIEPDDLPTSVATATLDSSGAAKYEFDLQWQLPALADEFPELLGPTSLIHTGSIATVLSPGSETVLDTVRRVRPQAIVSFDPNCRPTLVPDRAAARKQTECFVELSDVVKASDEDLAWLYPDQTVEESARKWLKAGPAIVIVTKGSHGCWAASTTAEIAIPAAKTVILDTVGAGDSFMSALLSWLITYGYTESREALSAITEEGLGQLLTFAASAAAITISRPGADPPTRLELEHLPVLSAQ